uniref:GTP-binding protein 10 n=1 Tax=Petromyzon marinus TaxID=7757 RepID=A0AAJ7WR38_PETMA|nr:GTP-binding protein 10 isoform X1 [Petromyzon marinus]
MSPSLGSGAPSGARRPRRPPRPRRPLVEAAGSDRGGGGTAWGDGGQQPWCAGSARSSCRQQGRRRGTATSWTRCGSTCGAARAAWGCRALAGRAAPAETSGSWPGPAPPCAKSPIGSPPSASRPGLEATAGAKGKDFQIEVPLGISVHTDDGTLIGEVNSPEDRVRVAVGGLGGGLTTDYQPSPGQRRMIRLDLKLIADVGLIGFPNAGKSTLLEKLSSAKPKIADYPFTTLCPQIGTMMFQDHRQISVADLPGLIEGAHANKGMGHHFLKHVQRNKILLFVVDVFGFRLSPKTHFRDAFQTVQLLVKELELYDPDLLGKAAVLAVNKMDLPGAQEKYKQLCHQLMHPQDFLSLLPAGMVPVERFPFEHVLPVVAVQGKGVDELKIGVRKVLDEQQVEAVMKVREEMGFIRVAGVGDTDVARVQSH